MRERERESRRKLSTEIRSEKMEGATENVGDRRTTNDK